MEGVFCMCKFTTIKGYFSSCQSLLCRMSILNSNALKRKQLLQQSVVYLDVSLYTAHLRLLSFFKFTEDLLRFSCNHLVSHAVEEYINFSYKYYADEA